MSDRELETFELPGRNKYGCCEATLPSGEVCGTPFLRIHRTTPVGVGLSLREYLCQRCNKITTKSVVEKILAVRDRRRYTNDPPG